MRIIILLATYAISSYCQNIDQIFEDVNKKYLAFNSLAADLSWESSINPTNPYLAERTANYQKNVITWQQNTCRQLAELGKRQLLNAIQRRQTYILCRGPKFTYREARALSSLNNQLQSIYSNVQICVPTENDKTKQNTTSTEAAILNYLSKMKFFFNRSNETSFAAKTAVKNFKNANGAICLNGEKDFEKLMQYSRNEKVLKWLWLVWREKMVVMKEPYDYMVKIQNDASKRNGYQDIGASWRDELEIPNLRQVCRRLYSEIKPLYTMLHGVVRFYLRRIYRDIVPERGPIPAHLLGNLWSQNWSPLIDLISKKSLDLSESIKNKNWTVHHMVKRVEDFYQSMGLPPMTDAFWRESVFENKNGVTRCHGTAADMFKDDDYRLIYCAGTRMEDFYVLHHEFGHIQYYMAYANQPAIFRQANAAIQESIGDAIMYGVMTPQHLHRLGLVNDSVLYVNTSETLTKTTKSKNQYKTTRDNVNEDDRTVFRKKIREEIYNPTDTRSRVRKNWQFNPFKKHNDEDSNDKVEIEAESKGMMFGNFTNEVVEVDIEDLNTDEIILLKQALAKVPQIPFALLIDEYRWKYFEGSLDSKSKNKEFWKLAIELQGITPPEDRGEEYFDIGAQFHVPDNTAYIRYFLGSFLQHQIFEALCRASVFGNRNLNARIPDTISLNRCDIYGSKAAGKLLKDLMFRGNSQHWREILQSTTGNTDITAAALQRYYHPLFKVLARIIEKNKIPLGW